MTLPLARSFARLLPRGLLGRVDRLRFIYLTLRPRKGLLLLASVGSLALGLAAALLDPSAMLVFTLTGIGGLAASAWQLYRNLAEVPRVEEERRFGPDDFARLRPSVEEEREGFACQCDPDVPEAAVLYSAAFNARLRDQARDWALAEDDGFRRALYAGLREHGAALESVLRYFGRKYAGRDFRNEAKIGLCSPLRADGAEVRIFRTGYYASFLTNELAVRRMILAEDEHPQVLHEAPYPAQESLGALRLKEFGASQYSNHLGASVLGMTRDRHFVFWRQNSRALVARGLLVPTGSGSCDWEDYAPGATLKQTVLAGMRREFREESLRRGGRGGGVEFLDARLIAYFRNLQRGGKPEFVALALIDADLLHLAPNLAEVDRGLDGHQALRERQVASLADLDEFLGHLLDAPAARKQLSVPLWVGLRALREYRAAAPAELAAFLRL